LIIFKSNTLDDDLIGDKLLNVLIHSKTNLKEIRFFNNFRFSLRSLETFLKNWKGRPALSIFTCNTTYQENYYTTLINEYKNVGKIENFEIIFEEDLYIHDNE
jgi:hypothetical protein